MKRALILILFCLTQSAILVQAQSSAGVAKRNYPTPVEGDYVIPNFKFRSGETLPELRLHYTTIGTPARDDKGVVRNAVLIMHGTGGAGNQFLTEQFGGVLFGPGQLLDATKYFIVLPDG